MSEKLETIQYVKERAVDCLNNGVYPYRVDVGPAVLLAMIKVIEGANCVWDEYNDSQEYMHNVMNNLETALNGLDLLNGKAD